MPERRLSHPEKERIVRLIFRFLDLSRDLERNRDDALFKREGGKINYVFDASVFELFVNPQDQRGRPASLHTFWWALHSDQEALARWPTFVSQTVLLTCEYLFSGNLPGQRDGTLYMTQWHRWELARRVEQLAQGYEDLWRGASEDQRRTWLEQFSNPVDDSGSQSSHDASDPDLLDDFRRLQSETTASSDLLKKFKGIRHALRAFAADEVVEPREQLARIVTPPMRNRFLTFHLVARPRENERLQIARDTRAWLDRLLEECKIHGIRVIEEQSTGDSPSEDRRGRNKAALRDDARTLAFVRWAAANHVKEGERTVFVTADSVAFDAYRRWYSGLSPEQKEYSEPFVLRRLVQYAPIFNLKDSGIFLEESVTGFFEQLAGTLETTMLPFNLSRLKNPSRDEKVLTRMRELDALRLLDNKPIIEDFAYRRFVQALSDEKIESLGGEVNGLLEDWRRLERTALGLAETLIRHRIERRKQKHRELFSNRDADAQRLFEEYVGGLVSGILEGSLRLSLPLAREFIEDWKPKSRTPLRRAPINIRLEVTIGGSRLVLGQVLEDWRAGRTQEKLVPADAWPALLEEPALVFAMAACLALASEDWLDADRFADMASRLEGGRWSVQVVDSASMPKSNRLYELRYLNALTKRFRVGVIGPPINADSAVQLKRTYDIAKQLIDSCSAYHAEQSPRQSLRLIRALSEGAAVRLFFAAAIEPSVRRCALANYDGGNGVATLFRMPSSLVDEAKQALVEAQVALFRCIEIERNLGDQAALSAGQRSFIASLEKQYLPNLAACSVIGHLWDKSGGGIPVGFKTGNIGNDLVERVRRFAEQAGDSARALLRAELLGSLTLSGDSEARAKLIRLKRPALRMSLIRLDAALFDAILHAFA
jgi:hypothetical protein